jgi:hypothetical protein
MSARAKAAACPSLTSARGIACKRDTLEGHGRGRADEQPAAQPCAATARQRSRAALRDGVLHGQAFDRDLSADHRKPARRVRAIQGKPGAIDDHIDARRGV